LGAWNAKTKYPKIDRGGFKKKRKTKEEHILGAKGSKTKRRDKIRNRGLHVSF